MNDTKLSKLQRELLAATLAGHQTKYRSWCDYDFRDALTWFLVAGVKREPRGINPDTARKSLWRAVDRLVKRGLVTKKWGRWHRANRRRIKSRAIPASLWRTLRALQRDASRYSPRNANNEPIWKQRSRRA
jgi:hypothetical protein